MSVVLDFLDKHGVAYRTEGPRTHAGWAALDCPWCLGVPGKHAPGLYLGVHLASGRTNCWRCGPLAAGATLAKLAGVHVGEVLPLLKRLELSELARAPRPARGRLEPPEGLGPLGPLHRGYLKARGLNPDECARLWGLRGVGQTAGMLSWRIYVPVVRRGEEVSWTTRALLGEPRYLAARPDQSVHNIKDCLLGEDYVRGGAVVVEGPFDVFRIGPGAVCTFGTTVTPAQVLRLSKIPRRLVCFDREGPARAAARRLCRRLALYPGETKRAELRARDPGEADRREIAELRAFLED